MARLRLPRYWKRKLADKKVELFDIYYEAYELSPAKNVTVRKKLWNKRQEKEYWDLAFGCRPNSAQLIFSTYVNDYQMNLMASANGTGKSFWCTGQEFHAHLTGFRPFFCDVEAIIEHIVDTEDLNSFDIIERGKEFFFTYDGTTGDGGVDEKRDFKGEIPMDAIYNLYKTMIPPVDSARIICADIQHIGNKVIAKWIPRWCGPWIVRDKKNQQGISTIYEFEFAGGKCELDVVSTNDKSGDTQALEGWEGQYLGIEEPVPKPAWTASIRGLRDIRGGRLVGALTPISYPWMLIELARQANLPNKNLSWLDVDYSVNRHNLKDNYYETLLEFYGKDEAEARIYGRYRDMIGLVLPMFKRKDHTIPLGHNFHYPPRDWIRFRSIDVHGVKKGQAVVYAALGPLGQLVVYHEIWDQAENVKALAETLWEYEQEERYQGVALAPSWSGNPDDEPDTVYWITLIDPLSATVDLSSGTCTAHLLEEYGIRDLEKGSKDLQLRVKVMREWCAKDRLFVSEGCEEVLWELSAWRFKKEKSDTAKKAYNTPMDRDNDMLEALGRIMVLDPKWIWPQNRNYLSRSDVFGRYDNPEEDVTREGQE